MIDPGELRYKNPAGGYDIQPYMTSQSVKPSFSVILWCEKGDLDSIHHNQHEEDWEWVSTSPDGCTVYRCFTDEKPPHPWLIPERWHYLGDEESFQYEIFEEYNRHFLPRLVKWQTRHLRETTGVCPGCLLLLSIQEGKNFPREMVEAVLVFLTCLTN